MEEEEDWVLWDSHIVQYFLNSHPKQSERERRGDKIALKHEMTRSLPQTPFVVYSCSPRAHNVYEYNKSKTDWVLLKLHAARSATRSKYFPIKLWSHCKRTYLYPPIIFLSLRFGICYPSSSSSKLFSLWESGDVLFVKACKTLSLISDTQREEPP